jgi:hypothetical protein
VVQELVQAGPQAPGLAPVQARELLLQAPVAEQEQARAEPQARGPAQAPELVAVQQAAEQVVQPPTGRLAS